MRAVTAAHLSIEEKRTSGESILMLTGEIDMATAGQLRDAMDGALSNSGGRVVLDFAGVTFCDSQGLSALIAVNRTAKAAGSRLVLVNLGEFMKRLLDITGLGAVFQVNVGSG